MALYRYQGKRLLEAYKREPIRGIEEWAEKEIVFKDLEVSPILGNFKVKYSPHYKKLFKIVERVLTRELFAKWASQSGKSLFGVIVAAHKLDTLPATVIYAQPLKDDISVILQTKINPVLKSIPKLWKKFEDYKETEKIRTKDAAKKLAGGNFLVKGSGVKDRKSQTSPFIVGDEIAEFEEGSITEFKERSKSFTKFHPKLVGLSTIVHPKDEICTNFDTCSVKIEWHYICMECEGHFYPDIKLFKYKKKKDYLKEKGIVEEEEIVLNKYIDEAKATVHMECLHCQHKINTIEKDTMIDQGYMDWFIKHENGTYELLIIENLTTETSFGADMNSFGSFFVTFEDMVENIIKAGDDEVKLDKLYRGWFNRFYKKEIKKADQNDMLLLGNNTKEWVVPKDTVKIYLTIDNQMDYLFAQVTAVGYGVVPNIVFFGRIETWNDAEEMWNFCQYLEDEDGETYMVSKMMIDRRGYNEGQISRTDEADIFISHMTKIWGEDRIYAGEGHPYIAGGKSFVVKNHKDYSNQRNELKVKVIKFSNLYIKNQLFRSIERTIAKEKAQTEEDDGFDYSGKLFYINQCNIERDMEHTDDSSITKMLTAEVFDYAVNPKTQKKALEKSWIPIRKRNDAIDTSSMALVFADMDKIILMKKHSNENLSEALKGLADLNFS